MSPKDLCTSKKVCNINEIMNMRFVFGHYSYMNKPVKIRVFRKLYCAAFVALLTIIFHIYATDLQPIYFLSNIEYVVASLISIWVEDKYIFKYYQYSLMDNLPYAKNMYKKLESILKICLISIIALRGIRYGLYCIVSYEACFEHPSVVVLLNIMWFARDIGRFPVVIVFSLLFCRVRVLRKTLLTKGFDDSPKNRLTATRYIHMYEMLVDGLNATDKPLKFLIINNMCCGIPPMLLDMYNSIAEFKENGPTYSGLLWIMLRVTEPLAILFVAALLLDLMSEDVVQMMCFTQEKCMLCANERDRSEIQKLLKVLRERPLRYSVYRVVNLTIREMASFYSFSITTIIAILQIKSF